VTTGIPIIYNFPLAGVASSFTESIFAGKIIVVVLIFGSIIAWSIMVSKLKELKHATSVSQRFLQHYRREDHPLNLFLGQKKFSGSPVYDIYEKACVAIAAETDKSSRPGAGGLFARTDAANMRLSRQQMEYIRNLAERNVADHALLLEVNMGYLASTVSSAPLLGLLGTVWGVMESFGAIAITGTATLSAVAPGISGALLTTVVGILVALPSAIGFNWITNRIRGLCVEMDNFAQEFTADIQRHLGTE